MFNGDIKPKRGVSCRDMAANTITGRSRTQVRSCHKADHSTLNQHSE